MKHSLDQVPIGHLLFLINFVFQFFATLYTTALQFLTNLLDKVVKFVNNSHLET